MTDNQNHTFYTQHRVQAWSYWLIAALIYFFQYGLLIFPNAISKELMTSLQLTPFDLGIMTSAFLLPYIAMQIPAGLLFDYFRARSLLIFSASMMAAGCFIFASSHHIDSAFWGRALMGFGGSFAFLGALAMGRTCFIPALFPIIVGLTEAMSGLGELGLSSTFAWLKRYQSWQLMVVEVGVILVILALLVFALVHKERPINHKKAQQPITSQLKILLANQKIWLLSLYIGFSFTQFVVMTDLWGVPFLQIHYHMDTMKAVFDNDMVIIGFTLGCAFIGWFVRYLRERRLILITTVSQFILISSASYLTTPQVIEALLLLLLGIAMSGVVLCFGMAKQVVPESTYGVVSGFINMFFCGFGMLIMPLVGYLFNLFDKNIFIAVIPVMICSFIAVVLAFIINADSSFDSY